MSRATGIEWTETTWNPIVGCAIVSKGCTNCYAMRTAGARTKHTEKYAGLTQASKAGPVWTGKVRFWDRALLDPLRWRAPRRVFVNSMGDLFAENVPDEWIDRVFAVMALAPQHTFQILTKRPERMRAYLTSPGVAHGIYNLTCDIAVEEDVRGVVLIAPGIDERHAPSGRRVYLDTWPLPNVWLGTSVEDQAAANERIPLLLDTPAAIRFVSAEPLLGPIDLGHIDLRPRESGPAPENGEYLDMLKGQRHLWPSFGNPASSEHLDWVIVGGESGPNARPMHPDWPRSLRDQCVAAGVPFFFKQWGEWGPDTGPLPGGADPIMEARARCAAWTVGGWTFKASGYEVDLESSRKADDCIYRLGKKAAGRLLDGRTWDEYPA